MLFQVFKKCHQMHSIRMPSQFYDRCNGNDNFLLLSLLLLHFVFNAIELIWLLLTPCNRYITIQFHCSCFIYINGLRRKETQINARNEPLRIYCMEKKKCIEEERTRMAFDGMPTACHLHIVHNARTLT